MVILGSQPTSIMEILQAVVGVWVVIAMVRDVLLGLSRV